MTNPTTHPQNDTIGIIGWGRMGAPMGHRLLARGYPVVAFDLAPGSLSDAEQAGAQVAASPHAVAERCDVLITMLPHGQAVNAAAREPTGGILAGLKPGTLWLEMTSSDPAITATMGDEAATAGVDFIDAPVTGGVPKAESGELTVMAAGSPAAFERAGVILGHLAGNVFYVGDRPGMGDVVKTVNNLLSAANLLIAAEGLSLAVDYGIDPARLLDVVNAGTGQSNATLWKIPQYVLPERFDSGFTVGQYNKDLRIAMDVADARDVPMVLSHVAACAWDSLSQEMGEADHTEIVKAVLSGVPYQAVDPKENQNG